MSRPTVPPSPLGCELCARAERPPLTPGAALLAGAVAFALTRLPARRRRATVASMTALGGMMAAAMLGAASLPSWYDRHRQAWIETGDVAELHRMLRHPLPPQPEHAHARPSAAPSRPRWYHWALLAATLAVVVTVSRWGTW